MVGHRPKTRDKTDYGEGVDKSNPSALIQIDIVAIILYILVWLKEVGIPKRRFDGMKTMTAL